MGPPWASIQTSQFKILRSPTDQQYKKQTSPWLTMFTNDPKIYKYIDVFDLQRR